LVTNYKCYSLEGTIIGLDNVVCAAETHWWLCTYNHVFIAGISMSVPSSWEFCCYIVPSTVYITPTTPLYPSTGHAKQHYVYTFSMYFMHEKCQSSRFMCCTVDATNIYISVVFFYFHVFSDMYVCILPLLCYKFERLYWFLISYKNSIVFLFS